MAKPPLPLALLLLAAATLLGNACAPAEDEPETVGRPMRKVANLEPDHPAFEFRDLIRSVESWAAEGDPVGSELLILAKGKKVFHAGFGRLDREERRLWEPGARCRLRSLTKPLVATAVLMLHDRGSLELSRPVSAYLPEFRHKRWSGVSVADLLTHTAGLPHPGRPKPLAQYSELCELVADIAAETPRAARRAQVYSSAGYHVLGCLVTRVAGVPVEEFLRTELFEPLKLEETTCDGRPSSGPVASSYALSESGLTFRRVWDPTRPPELPFFRASGGVWSTASDYARFLRFWMNETRLRGEPVLSPALVARALRPPVGVAEKVGAHNHVWRLFSDPRPDREARPAFGHFGADESVAIADPSRDLVFVYLSQSRGGQSARRFADELTELFARK